MSIVKKIAIKGFKSILDQEIELGQLNVFIGTNGAGKSNLLEAIAMMSASIEGGIDYQKLSTRGARLSSPQIFRSSFKNNDRKNTFSIEATTNDLTYKMSINAVDKFFYNAESLKLKGSYTNLCGRSNKGNTLKGLTKGLTLHKIDREKSIIPICRSVHPDLHDLTHIEKFAIFSPSSPILRGYVSDGSIKSPLGLYGGRLAWALAEIMNQESKRKELLRFFELLDWFKQISTTENIDPQLVSEYVSLGRKVVTFKDKFMKTNFNDLYGYDVSEGALFILFVLVLLLHDESPDFIAIDNVDSALNPGLITNLMRHISEIIERDDKKQIILTTHNPSTLDALDLFNNNHRLLVVSRAKDGQTQIERIEPPKGMTKEGWEKKYYGLKLSEIWLSGAIGALTGGF